MSSEDQGDRPINFQGPAGVRTVQAVVLKSSIELYLKTGMRPTSGYGPALMAEAAQAVTGKRFSRSRKGLAAAVAQLGLWLEEHGTTGEHPPLKPSDLGVGCG